MIIFNNWQITAPRSVIARQYDNLSRRLEVVGNLPEGYTWSILVQVGSAMDVITLEPMEGGAGVTLTADQLSQSGYYQMQLRGTQVDVVRHTNVISVFIPASLSGDGQWPTLPSEFTQAEQRIRELNEHPSIPGQNGFWMVWDTEADQYVESEFKVQEILPSCASPYQQLVTDGDGNAKWEDRLCYETEPVLTEFLPEQSFTGTEQTLTGGSALFFGQTYIVKFDNTEYECICVDLYGAPAIGNAAIIGFGSDTGEPFLLGYTGEHLSIYVSDETATHTVSIITNAKTIKKIEAKFLSKGLIVNIIGDKSDGFGTKYLLFDKTDDEINEAAAYGETVQLNYNGFNLQYIPTMRLFWGVLPFEIGFNGITKLSVVSVEKMANGWYPQETHITTSSNSVS